MLRVTEKNIKYPTLKISKEVEQLENVLKKRFDSGKPLSRRFNEKKSGLKKLVLSELRDEKPIRLYYGLIIDGSLLNSESIKKGEVIEINQDTEDFTYISGFLNLRNTFFKEFPYEEDYDEVRYGFYNDFSIKFEFDGVFKLLELVIKDEAFNGKDITIKNVDLSKLKVFDVPNIRYLSVNLGRESIDSLSFILRTNYIDSLYLKCEIDALEIKSDSLTYINLPKEGRFILDTPQLNNINVVREEENILISKHQLVYLCLNQKYYLFIDVFDNFQDIVTKSKGIFDSYLESYKEYQNLIIREFQNKKGKSARF